MRRMLLALVTFAVLTATFSYSEATVLPAGTALTLPDGTTLTLDVAQFLLTRSDMEAATTALATVDIQQTAIDKLANEASVYQFTTFAAAFLGVLTGVAIVNAIDAWKASQVKSITILEWK